MSSDAESCNEQVLEVLEGEEIVCETVYVKPDETEEDDEDYIHPHPMEGQRPVRPVERQKMRPWLIELLDANTLPGLSWQNRKENIFRISWKHAAHNCFNRNKDSDLFERWAYHTGRHHEGNHKRWKANFRCALNSLPDVMELKDLGVRKGDNAFKVYKFLDSPEPTMKEKLEIKRKYSLMAGIKADESPSGSSTPTSSTAPSSPDKEGQTGADGGILTLLKAIELKSLQQKDTKSTQKRGASTGTTPGRGKRARKDTKSKEKETEETVDTDVLNTVILNRPSPASTPGSDTGTTKLPIIDPKTGKMTIVELRKSDSVTTETSSTDITKLFSLNSNILALQTASPEPTVQPDSLVEKSVAIPLHLLQNELQKQTGLLNLSAILSGTSLAQLTKQAETLTRATESSQTATLTVRDQLIQARQGQQKVMVTKTSLDLPTMETQQAVPQPQVNRNITSIAAALRMSSPGSPTLTAAVATAGLPTTPVTTFSVAQDPQGIRSKLVSRLMVSGSTMTNQNTSLRMQSPTSTPRPRLDQILVKPNPVLNLPKTQLLPVKTPDVILATASSSNMDVMSGLTTVPRLITGSERTLDLNSIKSQLIIPASTITRETEVVSSPSPVCTPELRPDILDKQVTIELSKMETHKQPEEMQHLSENYSRRTVQTQCNMYLWNYLNGKQKESGKSDVFSLPVPLPPSRKTAWTQCSFFTPAAMENMTKAGDGKIVLKSGEVTKKKKIFKEAIGVLKLPQYHMLSYKVIPAMNMKKKALLITNKERYDVLGHGVNPLTLTLMSNGKVTLNVVFRSIEKFSVKNKDKGINVKNFKDILDRVATYSFCVGIKKNMWKKLRGNTDLEYLKYPFRRYQSVHCPVWFPSATVTSQCQHCSNASQVKVETPVKVKSQINTVRTRSRITAASPQKTVTMKDVQRVVVEPVECLDTVLQCVLPQ